MVSTRTANALADALTEAIEEEVQNMDTCPIVDAVMEQMNDEYATKYDLDAAIEMGVDDYLMNHDLKDEWAIQQMIDDTFSVDEILSRDEIEQIMLDAIEQRTLRAKMKVAWAGFIHAFHIGPR